MPIPWVVVTKEIIIEHEEEGSRVRACCARQSLGREEEMT